MEEENAFVRLIWDFRGADGQKTAEHHAVHLNEFFERENEPNIKIGTIELADNHVIAFAEVPMEKMILYRDALKPNRGEYVD